MKKTPKNSQIDPVEIETYGSEWKWYDWATTAFLVGAAAYFVKMVIIG